MENKNQFLYKMLKFQIKNDKIYLIVKKEGLDLYEKNCSFIDCFIYVYVGRLW